MTRPVTPSLGISLGIFVGGRGSRMGGRAKGLLRAPSGATILEHQLAIARRVGLDPVIVGAAEPYAAIAPEVPRLDDDPSGIGPLGGLSALLARAGARDAIAIACDMPHLAADDLERLATSSFDAAVLAARRAPDAPWEPLFARYRSPTVEPVLRAAIADGVRSFQQVLCRLRVAPFEVASTSTLVDWDHPEDLER